MSFKVELTIIRMLATMMSLMAVAILGIKHPTLYNYSRFVSPQEGDVFKEGISRLECALECFKGKCVRFVHSTSGCMLFDNWELEVDNSKNYQVSPMDVEYKMTKLCPRLFDYDRLYHQCYFTSPWNLVIWREAIKICKRKKPFAHLVIVEDNEKAINVANYLELKDNATPQNLFWTAGHRYWMIGDYTFYWAGARNQTLIDMDSLYWQDEEADYRRDDGINANNTRNCIAVGRKQVGLSNQHCDSRLPFVCQVDANI